MSSRTKIAAGAAGMTLAMLPATAVRAAGTQSVPQSAASPVVAPIKLLPSPAPSPSPSATPPARLRGLDDFSLPSDRPTTRVSPTPASTATPPPVPRPSATPTPTPTPVSGPKPRKSSLARPTDTDTATPRDAPTPPVVGPSPAPVTATLPRSAPSPGSIAAPSRAATQSAAAVASDPGWPVWPWIVGALAGAAALALILLRHRRTPDAHVTALLVEPAIVPPPTPPTSPPIQRARLAIDLSPRRGGLTLISLVFEGELVVRNAGDAIAERVMVEASLIPARSGQDDELAALFARPIARPAAPPFALAPGEERRVRLVAALSLAGVEPLVAGGRAMIVPVLAVNVVYASGEGDAQTAASWIVGVARAGNEKLAPFWVDAPGLSDTLGARAHSLRVER